MAARTNQWRVSAAGLAAVTLCAAVLGGCSPGPMIDRLPSDLGLPAGAPARPAESTYQYPAVHDMPPPRANETMSEKDQDKLEKDLIAVRTRQEKMTGTEAKEAPKKQARKPAQNPATAAKKKPSDANAGQNQGQTAGGKANP